MSLRYLPEHAERARQALALAEREAHHLAYTARTLFAEALDPAWVAQLPQREDRAEKLDAFVSRFARLQDHLGDKLLPRFAALLGEAPRSLLDVLAFGERMGWIDDAEAFVGARKLRNLLVHEYLTDTTLFLDSLRSAASRTQMLLEVVARLRTFARDIDLPGGGPG
ncbi:MAG: hypothetical protein VKP62_13245 [Candidatus Sericytochromatia bacterium]|nr:hypothetical protein [Candidatus Sericytochromatia bacterium]